MHVAIAVPSPPPGRGNAAGTVIANAPTFQPIAATMRTFLKREDVHLWLERAAVAALIGYFVAVGFAGIDFGSHWDEPYQVAGLKDCVSSLTWFPKMQVYNGVYFIFGVPFLLVKAARFLPAIVAEVANNSNHPVNLAGLPSVQQAQAALTSYLDSTDYLFGVRRAFVCVTSLAILWVYLAVRTLRPRPRACALCAAAFVALSWEVGYHARFIAVDDVVMQFIALELYAFCRCWRASDPIRAGRWAALTAAAAAAAWAGKTPALLAVLPAAALVFRPGLGGRERRWIAVKMLGVYGATAFVLSPWAFIDPLRYLGDMAFARHAYNDAGVLDAQYVPSWFEHLGRATLWLAAAVPSPIVLGAVALSVVALVGWSSRIGSEPRIAIWTVFVALYLALMSLNRTLIVRNYMLAVPFVAAMVGLGVGWLLQAPRARWQSRLARGAVAVVVATLCFNAGWGVRAAASIQKETAESVLERFRRDREGSEGRFRLSPGLAAKLGGAWTARMQCRAVAAAQADPSSRVYLLYGEHQWNRWVNNRLGGLDDFYGPLDANHDWYVTFPGRLPWDRIAGLSPDRARATFLDTSSYVECARPVSSRGERPLP